MVRFSLPLVLALLATGCHAPMPSFQPFAGSGSPRVPPPSTGSYGKPDGYYNGAPAGAQSMNNARSMKADETSGARGAGAASNVLARQTPSAWHTSDQPVGTGTTSTAAVHSGVQPAAASASAHVGGVSLPVGARISRDNLTSPQGDTPKYASPVTYTSVEKDTENRGSGSAALALHGMPINDATQTARPQRFVPTGQMIEISQLPHVPAGAGSGSLRGFGQPGAASVPNRGVTSTMPAGSATGATTAAAASPAATTQLSADGWRSKYVPFGGAVNN